MTAQEPERPASRRAPEPVERAWGAALLFSLQWDRLLGTTAGIGVGRGFADREGPRYLGSGIFGPYVLVEPGWRGGAVKVGWAAGVAADGIPFGAGLAASLVRTWNGPTRAEDASTYAGPELSACLMGFHMRAGWLWQVSGMRTDRTSIFALSLGIGFP